MKRVLLLMLLLVVPGMARAEDESNVYENLLEKKAPSIVTIKYVMKLEFSFGGQSQEQETRGELQGVVIDSSGLIMTSSQALSFERQSQMGQQDFKVKLTGSQLKVLVHDDEEDFEENEHEAVIAAIDSKLGLAFVQIVDLGDTELQAVTLGDGKPIDVGMEFVGVSRLGKGFDYAPFFGSVLVTGVVKVPRHMYAFSGNFGQVGLPVYTEDGALVGVLVTQESAVDSGGGGLLGGFGAGRQFLLPVGELHSILEQVREQADEALEKAAEDKEEEDEGDEEEEEEEGM